MGVLVCSSAFAAGTENRTATQPTTFWDQAHSFDLAKVSAEAHVVYVSSGSPPAAHRLIDGNPGTNYKFSGADGRPTLVVELGSNNQLHKVTATFAAEDGRMDVYLLDELNDDPEHPLKGKPFASIPNPADGKAAVEFEPHGARYVAFQWIRKRPKAGPFVVAEVGAFGVTPTSAFDFVEPPSAVQSTIHMTSNGGPDFSNSLGTLADPPVVRPISP